MKATTTSRYTGDWIATWTASPQPIWDASFPAPIDFPRKLWNQTIRQVARVSIGGDQLRVVLSNEYGTKPLVIGEARVAHAAGGASIVLASGRALTFGGRTSITIPPGAPAVSDPVDLSVPPLGSLSISLFLPEISPTSTMHYDGRQTAHIVAGNKVGAANIVADVTTQSRLFLSGIWVDARPGARALVVFSDSIADGDGSTPDTNRRWPDTFAERLVQVGGTPMAVLNQGISGARMLSDGMGVNALARFDRDVLGQPGVDTVILMMGLNDIGWPGGVLAPPEAAPSAQDIVAGYRQLITRAHARNIRILGATLTPFENALIDGPFGYFYNPQKELERVAVNQWIRGSGEFDGVIDFDAVMRDPSRPSRLLPTYDQGDHLHMQDAGYRAMAECIDIELVCKPH